MPFAATQMDLEIIILGEVRQRNIVQYPLDGESKKKLYKWTYKTEWGEVRKDTYEGKREEFGMDMYMLLYLKWIINKDLLYSTGKSTQHYIAI